ncbi:hypothetical protein [Spirosoma montaniterrae]|uniref:Ig-like domain-containing protein n=1 Tax=Spirosoma montaniterrae TaxID=1178516 RepID=A0A1P9WRB1_9BACT|nr:hypothetical protein [Spirosoma montaniterrae]AQG77915.1 hypothetical protein AWR27_00225 [Spirosoma montaniterrae]
MRLKTLLRKKRTYTYALACLGFITLLSFSSRDNPPGENPPKRLTGQRSLSYLTQNAISNPDPIRFRLFCNKRSVRPGELLELTVTAELLDVSPNLLFFLPGASSYKLKLLLPPNFVQTEGDPADNLVADLSRPANQRVNYRIVGYFTSTASTGAFRLLRSHKQADDQSLYVEKAAIRLKQSSERLTVAEKAGVAQSDAETLFIVADAPTHAARAAAYRGWLEFANCNTIGGWAADPANLRQSVNLDVYFNDRLVATIPANQGRGDVAAAFGADGFDRYGFRWDIPESLKTNRVIKVAVKIAGTSVELSQSPLTTPVCTGTDTPPEPPVVDPPVTDPPPANASYRGHLDGADCDGIGGWLANVNDSRKPQQVDIFVNGVKATTISTDWSRPDVANALGVSGFDKFGFRWIIPASYRNNAPLTISVRAANANFQLSESPKTTASCPGSGTTATCNFTVSASPVEASCGGNVRLSATCSGNDCSDQIAYNWTGNGISQSGQSITLTAPATNGSYQYTVSASRPGCAPKTATATVNVSNCPTVPPVEPPPPTGDYPILSSPPPADKRPFLQNERVRVAIDLGVGGVIREITDLQVGENMINCKIEGNGQRDPGRDDQISLYGFPSDGSGWTQNGKPLLADIGYNPVQGGSVAGEYSPVLGYGRTNSMLYCKTRGLHWGMSNELGDYVVEQWIRLEGNVVKRHVRITGNRPDQTQFNDVRQQELPCIYTNSAYYQYYVVQGTPYTNAPLIDVNAIPNPGNGGVSLSQHNGSPQTGPYDIDASEPWIMAVRPNTNRGLALHTPFSHEFKVAAFGPLGSGPAESANAGYISNGMSLRLDHNGVYEFDINVVVGTVGEMRNTINSLPRSETKPNYVFAGNATRHGFYYRKAYDQGFPVGNELVITPTDRRFRLLSPRKGYKAADFGVIYVRMRTNIPETQMKLDWRKVGQKEAEAETTGQFVTFSVINDNQYHTYAIPVRNSPHWNGIINDFGIRYLNPNETRTNGQQFGVRWISATDLGDK